jgi:hypothetical protein
MWMAILSFLGGPVIRGLIDAYQAKLKAGNIDSKIAADLAASGIAAQRDTITYPIEDRRNRSSRGTREARLLHRAGVLR